MFGGIGSGGIINAPQVVSSAPCDDPADAVMLGLCGGEIAQAFLSDQFGGGLFAQASRHAFQIAGGGNEGVTCDFRAGGHSEHYQIL